MGKAYSVDLRKRVLGAYDRGARPADLARQYEVGEWWIYKMLRQRLETGSIEPIRGQVGPKPKLAHHEERIRRIVGKHPGATLQELRKKLRLRVGITTLWRALRDLKLTLKKSHPRGTAEAA